MEKELIIKKAIILEKQGQAFYRGIEDKTDSIKLKGLFRSMANEESLHERQLKGLLNNETKENAEAEKANENPHEFADEVFINQIVEEISAASYEAAAISAAMELEIKTAEYYRDQAETAGSPAERAFFEKLSDWEYTHLQFLSKINRAILEDALKEELY